METVFEPEPRELEGGAGWLASGVKMRGLGAWRRGTSDMGVEEKDQRGGGGEKRRATECIRRRGRRCTVIGDQ